MTTPKRKGAAPASATPTTPTPCVLIDCSRFAGRVPPGGRATDVLNALSPAELDALAVVDLKAEQAAIHRAAASIRRAQEKGRDVGEARRRLATQQDAYVLAYVVQDERRRQRENERARQRRLTRAKARAAAAEGQAARLALEAADAYATAAIYVDHAAAADALNAASAEALARAEQALAAAGSVMAEVKAAVASAHIASREADDESR